MNNAMSDFRDCGDCDYEPGDCLFCSDVVKNMFKPKKEEEMIISSFTETLCIGRYIEMVKLSESDPIAYEMERTRMHDRLCEDFELEKEETKDITDNLDKYDYDPHKVYRELLQRMCIKRGKRRL